MVRWGICHGETSVMVGRRVIYIVIGHVCKSVMVGHHGGHRATGHAGNFSWWDISKGGINIG